MKLLQSHAGVICASTCLFAALGAPAQGPAQDFHEQFPLNSDNAALNDADLHGVALAAIHWLNQKFTEQLEQKQTEITELKVRLTALKNSFQISTRKETDL